MLTSLKMLQLKFLILVINLNNMHMLQVTQVSLVLFFFSFTFYPACSRRTKLSGNKCGSKTLRSPLSPNSEGILLCGGTFPRHQNKYFFICKYKYLDRKSNSQPVAFTFTISALTPLLVSFLIFIYDVSPIWILYNANFE